MFLVIACWYMHHKPRHSRREIVELSWQSASAMRGMDSLRIKHMEDGLPAQTCVRRHVYDAFDQRIVFVLELNAIDALDAVAMGFERVVVIAALAFLFEDDVSSWTVVQNHQRWTPASLYVHCRRF